MTTMTANFKLQQLPVPCSVRVTYQVLLEGGFHPIALRLLHYLYMRFYTAAAFVGGYVSQAIRIIIEGSSLHRVCELAHTPWTRIGTDLPSIATHLPDVEVGVCLLPPLHLTSPTTYPTECYPSNTVPGWHPRNGSSLKCSMQTQAIRRGQSVAKSSMTATRILCTNSHTRLSL